MAVAGVYFWSWCPAQSLACQDYHKAHKIILLVGLRDAITSLFYKAGASSSMPGDLPYLLTQHVYANLDEAVAIVTRGTGGIHLSCDADWVDPGEAPGVGTPVRGGATLREAHLAMEIVHDSGALLAMDLVEINPILDRQNHTAELAADLIASAFGRRIL